MISTATRTEHNKSFLNLRCQNSDFEALPCFNLNEILSTQAYPYTFVYKFLLQIRSQILKIFQLNDHQTALIEHKKLVMILSLSRCRIQSTHLFNFNDKTYLARTVSHTFVYKIMYATNRNLLQIQNQMCILK